MVRLNLLALFVVCPLGLACIVSVDESVLDRPDGQQPTPEIGSGDDLGDGSIADTLGDLLFDGDMPEIGPVVCPGHKWKLMPSGVTGSLLGVWGSSTTDIWAVGTAGSIVHFDGSKWSKVTPAPAINTLYGVMGRAANDVWAVGSRVILHYDGNGWSKAAVTVEDALYSVWVDTTGVAWAVGEDGSAFYFNGSTWQSRKPATTNHLKAVWGSGPNDVWAAGEDGTILRHNGTAWSTVTSPVSEQIPSLRGLSQGAVWGTTACTNKPKKCSSEVIHYNGSKWLETHQTSSGHRLQAIWPFDATHLLTVGDACCDMSTCTCGRVQRFWKGKWYTEWLGLLTPPLRGVWASSSCNIWAVGYKGAVYHYSP